MVTVNYMNHNVVEVSGSDSWVLSSTRKSLDTRLGLQGLLLDATRQSLRKADLVTPLFGSQKLFIPIKDKFRYMVTYSNNSYRPNVCNRLEEEIFLSF